MQTTARALACLVALTLSLPRPQRKRRSSAYAKCWDGTRVLTDVLIVIDGDRIFELIRRPRLSPQRPELLDLRKYTVLPGLIDLHTHMTYYWDRQPGTRPLGQRRRPAVTVFLAQENARRTLETGVTTVRDLGAASDTDFAMRDLIAMGAMQGPRMIVAGQGISAPRQSTTPNPDAMRSAAEERIKNGSDWIKVYGSRGSFDSVDTTQTLTFDEMKAIVDVSHAAGHKVAIHSYGPSGVKDAVRAGADSVEHGIDLDDETIAEMVKRGTVWVPTIDHNRYYVDARDEYGFKPEAIPPLQDYIQKQPGVRATRGQSRRQHRNGIRRRLLDVRSEHTRARLVGEGRHDARAGAGHRHNHGGRSAGLPDRLGRLAPGYAADFVAVEGDPLQNDRCAVHRSASRDQRRQIVVDKRWLTPATRPL